MSKRIPSNPDDVSDTKRHKTDPTMVKQSVLKFPAHWKTMTGQSARFSVFQHDSTSNCGLMDASFACEILQNAFIGRLDLRACDRVSSLHCLGGGVGGSASAVPSQKKEKLPRKSYEKRDFYDLTVSSSDEQEEASVFPTSEGPFVLVLREMLKQLEKKTIRILEIEQLQNVQSFMMQKTFVDVNSITAPYETVYHGTDESAIDGIVNEGLRAMYSRRSRFGRGTYLSRSFDVACSFATPNQDGVRHIIVVHCQIGSVKQMGIDETALDFYTMSSDGKEKILNHTKEVTREKYLITGSDSQSICHALVRVKDSRFDPTDRSRLSNPQQLNNSNMDLITTFLTTINTATHAQLTQMHQNLGLSGVGGGALGGMSVLGGVSAIGGGGAAMGSSGMAALGGSANLFVGNMNINSLVPAPSTAAADKLDEALAEIKKKRQEMLGAEEENKTKAKAAKLLFWQTPLPAANIDLPRTRELRKNDIVSLYNMSKPDLYLQGQEGIIKLIVRECNANGFKDVIMVELNDASKFASIILANQHRERKNKNTGFSRYGSLMKEHYVICKYSQVDGTHAVIAPASSLP